MLKDTFILLVKKYTADETLVHNLWTEIEKKYNSRKRHYHNHAHLEALIKQISECRNDINDWDTMLFSIFYHDVIYNVLKLDNEEKSAALAVRRLSEIQVPADKIETCKEQILATKSHAVSSNPDTNLFTDADLSILGQPTAIYQHYCEQIRKEYSIYPDIIYKPGRRKVIAHFIAMPRIFKTAFFFDKYEAEARQNLQWEIERL